MDDTGLETAVRNTAVFARTTPLHKLRIVRALQANGERVLVTGDGTNDAPALAAADIGVAMGRTGTDVAREAAGIVLADDNYTTIVNAIREGRLLFENLRKGVRYYLACKVALILVNLLPVLLGAPLPFSPVQIILMELFMDLAASAAFVAEPAEADLLTRQPRDPHAKFMDRSMLSGILGGGIGLFASVISGYLLTWYGSHDLALAQTVAFFSWMMGHVLLALNLRSERQPLFQLGFFSNRLMLLWAAVAAIFLTVLSVFPALQTAVKIVRPSGNQVVMMLGMTCLGTFWLEVLKLVTFRKPR
jgi:Ca2+-transporting ATPase